MPNYLAQETERDKDVLPFLRGCYYSFPTDIGAESFIIFLTREVKRNYIWNRPISVAFTYDSLDINSNWLEGGILNIRPTFVLIVDFCFMVGSGFGILATLCVSFPART